MGRTGGGRVGRGLGALAAPAVLAAEVQSASDAASRRLTWTIVGLLVLAAVILFATVLYWRATRPPKVSDPLAVLRQGTEEEPPPLANGHARPLHPPAVSTFAPRGGGHAAR